METPKRHVEPDNPTNPWYTDGTVDYDRVQGNNPAGGADYPRMLYKAGGTEILHGHAVSTVMVYTSEEEDVARDDGYRRTPKDAAALSEKKTLAPVAKTT